MLFVTSNPSFAKIKYRLYDLNATGEYAVCLLKKLEKWATSSKPRE
jgi:hypothetical protein